MSKIFYCSNCGVALEVKIKAFKGDTVRVVASHFCTPLTEGEGYDFVKALESNQSIKEADGEFVQKLNDLSPEPEIRAPGWPKDERPQPADLRDPVSTAPLGAQDSVNVGGKEDSPDPRTVSDHHEVDSGVGSDE